MVLVAVAIARLDLLGRRDASRRRRRLYELDCPVRLCAPRPLARNASASGANDAVRACWTLPAHGDRHSRWRAGRGADFGGAGRPILLLIKPGAKFPVDAAVGTGPASG